MKAISVLLTVLLVFSTSLQAGPIPDQKTIHLLSIEDLRDQVSVKAAERASNIREVQTLLRHEAVQDRLGHLYDLEKIAVAVPTLDNETLAVLARESEQMNEQFKAGLSTGVTVAIVIGVVLLVIIVILAYSAKETVESVFGSS